MMYDTIQRDLQEIIDILWKRDDVDMWSFDPYKGFCYILMQLYKNKNYQERKSELVSYLEHRFDDWQLYTMRLLLELMRNDGSIVAYERDKLPTCKFKSDLPNAIHILKRHRNSFILAGDISTDIYQEVIKIKKAERRDIILLHLKCYRDDYKDLYLRFAKYENIISELYKCFTQTHMPNTFGYPFEVKRYYDLKKPIHQWEMYLMWLEYEEDRKAFLRDYEIFYREYSAKCKAKFLAELGCIHKLICSKVYDEITVIKAFDRDTACELGCSSEEYSPSDWESSVEFNKDFKKFLSNCDIGRCTYYHFFIKDNGKEFKFTAESCD